MRKTTILFRIIGFFFEIIFPIILFGLVVPYWHGTLQEGLTGVGYLALIILALVIGSKVKKEAQKLPKSIWRGLILAIFPVIGWIIINIGAQYLIAFLGSFIKYWKLTIGFVILGRIFYIIDEAGGE